ncbi:MAG: GntR family transcriptional regulator [Anaerolineae bacterium]|nr:GntR family transcriptional regulator [Anaerolineae bacterium]
MMIQNQKPSLSLQTYQLIKEDIVTCVLDPGQFIAQADLAERYKVGITPVREALRQLTQEGFVQPLPRLGYIVSPITSQDVQEIFELREIFETASVRLAAERGTNESLLELVNDSEFTYTYKDRHSYTRFLNQNAEFHILIASISGNNRLIVMESKIMDELNRVFHLGLDLRDSAEEMREDHVALANAIYKRDSQAAEKLARTEIIRSRERVMEAIKRHQKPLLTPTTLIKNNIY